MKKLKKAIISTAVVYIILNFILLPKQCIGAAQASLRLCIETVIPSLFPFFAASSLFITLGLAALMSRFFSKIMRPVFNVSGSGSIALLLGIISGYPVGASASAELYKNGHISKTEAERLLAFTNNSGPLFILGVLGEGILKSNSMGIILYISHILSALLCGIIFRFYGRGRADSTKFLSPSAEKNISSVGASVAEAVSSATENMLKVCGFVIFFSVVCAFIPSGKLYPYIYSLFEITGGLNALSKLELDAGLKLSLISFFLSFSGFSVMCQVSSFIAPCKLSMKPYLCGKIMQAIFSFYITKILFLRLQPYTETVSIFNSGRIYSENMWNASLGILFTASVIFAFILLIGFFLEKKNK